MMEGMSQPNAGIPQLVPQRNKPTSIPLHGMGLDLPGRLVSRIQELASLNFGRWNAVARQPLEGGIDSTSEAPSDSALWKEGALNRAVGGGKKKHPLVSITCRPMCIQTGSTIRQFDKHTSSSESAQLTSRNLGITSVRHGHSVMLLAPEINGETITKLQTKHFCIP
ncbi:hypothetical protein BJ508DRAFT_163259 [Ascobolus immersus RN42]|uniref:Uncharacterized protein n=1 Tax=Ascobolus immersus RN42 TaxID=1160509 RepID=A0A3N4I7N5_ASCIM|nr:hypothetical protein BJ508DRAFT_163259 [Ascobolus immersus RN42]